jgi:predicted Ser/Thr protein kinase
MNEADANPNMPNPDPNIPNPDPNMPNPGENQPSEQNCPQCGAPLPAGVLAGLCPACLMKQGAAADTAGPDIAAFQPPGVEEVARLFPQLEVIALIGKGGMGAVYRARQRALDRVVALKILPPQTAAGPGFVERFNREARALAKLNHPNIVAVYEFGQVSGLSYFIMEYVDGLNLRELERAGKLSPREALQIVPQICEALQFAHDEGIVHRDIKPENILLDKKGRVKIADFGIAKILSGGPNVDLTGTQAAIGTPHYMAPEQMEKPTSVDHRADIFSLGVVFYEMLTGELPLGKFAPPSSRKVEVDVRLDDVVLRALEKDPDRRYQHASQVKTAVDTIVGSAPPPPGVSGTALAQEILARDYTFSIRSCIRRGWKLLKGEFWPLVGITALFLALLDFAGVFGGASIQRSHEQSILQLGSAVAILVWGPLMGGLMFYFLKKIRLQPATVETAFCGFGSGPRFLQLFLAGFVTWALTWLGLVLLIVPGVYLLVAWMFTLPLVLDKGLDFWSAMEVSRKVITKHWFKFLGFGMVMLLLTFAGLLCLIVGVFVVSPLILAAQMYAYEDIFGTAGNAAPQTQPGAAPAGAAPAGPTGTVVIPTAAFAEAPPGGKGLWTLPTKIGLAAAALVILVFIMFYLLPPRSRFAVENARRHLERTLRAEHAPRPMPENMPETPVPPELPAPPAPAAEATPAAAESVDQPVPAFGPVTERELTNLAAINLASGEQGSLPSSVASLSRGPEKDSAACSWLGSAGMDLAYVGAYDGFYSMTRDIKALDRGSFDQSSPESLANLLHGTDQVVGGRFGDSSPMNNPTNFSYGFKLHDGRVGLLQVLGITENPPDARIRYKLVQLTTNPIVTAGGSASAATRELLSERLEAASSMTVSEERDKPLAAIAKDAAEAGEVQMASKALEQIWMIEKRDAATRETALLLAKKNLRKAAVELAKGITNFEVRNQTLSELAQQNIEH